MAITSTVLLIVVSIVCGPNCMIWPASRACASVAVRCVHYNICSALRPGRLVHFVEKICADITMLTGTRFKSHGQAYTVSRIAGKLVIQWGWARAPFSSRSAGCTMILGRRFRAKYVKRIMSPASALQGRVGAVRLQLGSFDLWPMVGYPLPIYGTTWQQAALRIKLASARSSGYKIVMLKPRNAPRRWLVTISIHRSALLQQASHGKEVLDHIM